ncbi:MAG: hypothetical protein QUV02_01925 [Maricaulis sp.]|uniref:hypothetical protein n=1 Tax=unclassified Maricaulis TaxID=2632371 RepID=UPI00260E516A|nr:hypothetical protein [Maricaulis sp.]MDM7983180.1 hypothetical protein [Maricaulis sp.]
MERSLYRSGIVAMPKGGGEKRSASIEVAASGHGEFIQLVNDWLDEQSMEACNHGSMTRLRKARRQEPSGVVSAEWAE